MEIGIQGSILAPTLYKGLDTHTHSKKHKIRGYSKGNSHVLEIVEKGIFLAEQAMISDFFFGNKGYCFPEKCLPSIKYKIIPGSTTQLTPSI